MKQYHDLIKHVVRQRNSKSKTAQEREPKVCLDTKCDST